MRNLKFRAWDKKQEKMITEYNDSEDFSIGLLIGLKGDVIDRDRDICQDDFVLMQFTGLLDKNGNEIYEGDIVKSGSDETEEIKWNHDGFYPCLIHNEKREIIGNIYEIEK